VAGLATAQPATCTTAQVYREVTAMPDRHPDIQAVSDTHADLYEAIATLEYSGQRVTEPAIVSATGLPGDVVAAGLAKLVAEGLLVAEDDGTGDPAYVPARRGWSTVPGQAEGKGLG
jgi:hypothetical protein